MAGSQEEGPSMEALLPTVRRGYRMILKVKGAAATRGTGAGNGAARRDLNTKSRSRSLNGRRKDTARMDFAQWEAPCSHKYSSLYL